MNNEQFRRLLLANSAKSSANDQNGTSGRSTPGASALGSKQRSSIPMTPRSVAGAGRSDFARQLAERNQPAQTQKKVRTSAPKGSKLAEGYIDRARERPTDTEDDRAERLKALEEALKSEEIDQATFDKLRFEIAGGDLSSTHLVKGLDFKLLERIRKGEDVYVEKEPVEVSPEPDAEPGEDVDDALERLEGGEVQTVNKARTQKKGQLSTALIPGKKRTRDQILAELKAAREAAKAKEEASTLGSRFKKIGAKQAPGSRVERDSKGREVLVIVDEDGHEKRKVRKVAVETSDERAAFVPDKKTEVLGMEVPEFYKKKQQEQAEEEAAREENIFDDADSDYDPLAGMSSDSEDSGSEGEVNDDEAKATALSKKDATDPSQQMPPPPAPAAAAEAARSGPRNYFGTANPLEEESRKAPSLSDPAILAALQKARKLNMVEKSEEEQKEAERQERLKRLVQSSNRDEQDMDMGFGTNRVEDEDDGEDNQIKLSTWGDGDDGDPSKGSKAKRKRGPKKRKGDGNNAADVMRVLERRKAESS